MIHELQALGLPPLPDAFAFVPPRVVGLLLWVICAAVCIARAFGKNERFSFLPVAGVYTGLYINLYGIVDEVSINLEHAYNLYHYGRFSMSPEAMVDGTVEYVYYLLHAPFAWSQASLVAANFWISCAAGLLHLPLLAGVLGTDLRSRKGMLQAFAFAICAPLVLVLSSGFGNGLVSLVFLAAVRATAKGKETTSLAIAGMLPLLRPDAILLSFVNIAAIALWRRMRREPAILLHPVLALPLLSAAVYYAFVRLLYGHFVPVPIHFKALKPAMLEMLQPLSVFTGLLEYFTNASHAIGLILLLAVARMLWRDGVSATMEKAGSPSVLLFLYAAGCLPVLLFYNFTHGIIGDFSSYTYARYWVAFELTLQLFILSVLGNLRWSWSASVAPTAGYRGALILYVCATFPLLLGQSALSRKSGRIDSMFAGAFTNRYVPRQFTVATTEMSTFGLMLERPLIDLWGYSNPAIAHSKTCNGDRIRVNPEYFLAVKPDLYWPYWFTKGFVSETERMTYRYGDYDTVESSLAQFHHTAKQGNLLGDMKRVLAEYDVVMVRTESNTLAWLVRKQVRDELLAKLQAQGMKASRQRPFDMAAFGKLYDAQVSVSYRCGS